VLVTQDQSCISLFFYETSVENATRTQVAIANKQCTLLQGKENLYLKEINEGEGKHNPVTCSILK